MVYVVSFGLVLINQICCLRKIIIRNEVLILSDGPRYSAGRGSPFAPLPSA